MKFNWGTGIVITFALFFIGLAIIVVIAMRQRNDLVMEDYYAQELKHEEQIDRERRTAAMPEHVKAFIANGMVTVSFPRTMQSDGVSGTLVFYRPDDERKDFALPIALDSANSQYIPVNVLRTGHWRLKVRWKYDKREYYQEEGVIVP